MLEKLYVFTNIVFRIQTLKIPAHTVMDFYTYSIRYRKTLNKQN